MDKSYIETLHALKFSAESKQRLAQRIADAAQPRNATEEARFVPSATMSPSTRRTPRLTRPARYTAAAAVVLTCLLGTAGIAYGTGTLADLKGIADDVFNGAPASTEVIEKIGRPVGASDTSDGVTITADAVLGDRWNYIVVFSISKDDGSAFDIGEPNEAGLLPLMFDGRSSVHVDHIESAGGGMYFYDADPSDNAIQMVEEISISTTDGKSALGKTARAHFEDLVVLDGTGKHVVAQGSWDLKFVMNYEDATIDLPARFSTDCNGSQADVHSIELSPIAITVNYTVHSVMDLKDESGGGKLSEHDSAEMDRIMGLPVVVTLADGTVIDATQSGANSSENRDGTTDVQKTFIFDQLIEPESIQSLVVGRQEVVAL